MKNLRLEEKPHSRAVYAQLERLKENIWWFPFPALIAFGLAILLIGHLLTDLNPRLGSVADPIQLNTKPFPDGSIWVSINIYENQVVATTYDKKKFSWSSHNTSMKDLEDFVAYLKKKTLEETYRSVRLLESSAVRSKVVIAVDQNAKYIHLRPVIYALADAGIAKYAFETRIMKD
jgi:hypothetical protein